MPTVNFYSKEQTDSLMNDKVNTSNITHETWTFTLDDNSTVTKEIVLYVSSP